ncbi:GNAT family N-acetyltransferase [Thalassotalea sp. M1531]|uniref:GNAT family N-acetyltransferase n=1 Tax=Thalassotalea algicola TaxID=2716224 RepID=A0A7Y0L9L2_9GAMM|nr:GNAT family N-acetyltransferase [Thalassotalea algicola]
MKTISPSVATYNELRKKVGWGNTSPEQAKTALNNSLFHVIAISNEEVIGMARVIGDGAMFFYIQDLVVDPSFQRKGVGGMLMQKIESYLVKSALPGVTIGLLSAKGKENFYQRYGYNVRDGSLLGLGMCKFIE